MPATVQGTGGPDVCVLAGFFAVIVVCVALGKRLKVPAGVIIIPIISTAALTLLGFGGPPLPSWLISIAQVFVGIRIGMSVDIGSLVNWKRITVFSLLNVLGLTAMMVNADLPTVIAFQLFRLLFVYLIAMPVMRRWIRRKAIPITCRHNK